MYCIKGVRAMGRGFFDCGFWELVERLATLFVAAIMALALIALALFIAAFIIAFVWGIFGGIIKLF